MRRLATKIRALLSNPRDQAFTAEAVAARTALRVPATFRFEGDLAARTFEQVDYFSFRGCLLFEVGLETVLTFVAILAAVFRPVAVEASFEAVELVGEDAVVDFAVVVLGALHPTSRAAGLAAVVSGVWDFGFDVVPTLIVS